MTEAYLIEIHRAVKSGFKVFDEDILGLIAEVRRLQEQLRALEELLALTKEDRDRGGISPQ